MEQMVYKERNIAFGDNWEEVIMSPLLLYADATLRPFFQFDVKYPNPQLTKTDKKIGRVIGWAHPDNVMLLRQEKKANLFIDCTFKAVPVGWSQLMIVMTYAAKYDYYVPVFYVLMQDKTETSYRQAINAVIQASIGLEADTVTCDFEPALISGIKANFKSCKMVLCLFHFKQANRRWILAQAKEISKEGMKRLLGRKVSTNITGLQQDEYYERGLIEMLTVLPLDEIIPYGIPYIRNEMEALENESDTIKAAYDKFWAYFVKQWLQKKNMTGWNLAQIRSSMADHNDEIHLANRTNNPLERYNRTLNGLIDHAGLQLPQLVQIFMEEGKKYVAILQRIKDNEDVPPIRQGLVLPEIPESYWEFKADHNPSNTESPTSRYWYLEDNNAAQHGEENNATQHAEEHAMRLEGEFATVETNINRNLKPTNMPLPPSTLPPTDKDQQQPPKRKRKKPNK
jgi:hypothetical protein